MRSFVLASLILVGGVEAARASFDMMYLPNSSTMQRWDPVNRVALGTFSTYGGANIVSANAATTSIVVTAPGAAPAYFNGSSGEFLGFQPSGTAQGLALTANGDNYWHGSGSTLTRRVVGSGAQITSWSVTPSISVPNIVDKNGDLIVAGTSAGDLVARTYSSLGALLSSTTVALAASISSQSNISNPAFVSSNSGDFLYQTYYNSSGVLTLARTSMIGTSLGATTTSTLTGFAGPGASYMSLMAGHGGSLWVVGSDSAGTATRFYQTFFTGSSYLIMNNYTTTAVMAPTLGRWVGANVVAPEPATFLMMGAGLMGVLGRRRAKKRG